MDKNNHLEGHQERGSARDLSPTSTQAGLEPLSPVKKTKEASVLSLSCPICKMGIVCPAVGGHQMRSWKCAFVES